MDEWMTKLKQHCEEEKKDHDSYLELAKEAEISGHHEIAGVLKDITHDEKTHHDVLKHMLEM